jgi:C1A family cysteine protease
LGETCLVALAQGLPIVFGTFVPSEFYDIANKTGTMPDTAEAGQNPGGGHAMLLVGYDLATRTWLVRNSWGEEFAERGYFRIPFNTLQAYSPPDGFWTIGAIEQAEGLNRGGATVRDAMRANAQTAASDLETSLDRMRKNLRARLNADLDAAKAGFRDRLRGPGVGGGY